MPRPGVGGRRMAWLVVLGGYLLGSWLPAAWLVRRQHGGRSPEGLGENPGAAGTWRLLGTWAGLVVALLDALKGLVPVAVAGELGLRGVWLVLAAVAPVAGHNWPWYRGFRGGRGLATATGALLGLAGLLVVPGYLLGTVVAWWRRWVPALGVVGFPLLLALMLWQRWPADRVTAALAVMLTVLIRQVPWLLARRRGKGRWPRRLAGS